MPHVRIILMEPKFEGNVGAIARSMANFGFDDLVLINPCELGGDAQARAKHGYHILESARYVKSMQEAIEGCTLIVGTSGVTTEGDKNYTRIPVPVKEFVEKVKEYQENIAIIFGREDVGLLQEDLEKCDMLITIPTGKEYPILNLSHAATIVMYELCDGKLHKPVPASKEDKERLFTSFEELMIVGNYPEHRRHDTAVMFRKMLGRSIPSTYEYHTLMGVFNDAIKTIQGKKGSL